MSELLETGLLIPLLAAMALLIAIAVVARALTDSGDRDRPDRQSSPVAGVRVEPHLYAERGGAQLPVAQPARHQAATSHRAQRRGFGWVAVIVAFVLGGGAGVVTGGLIDAPGWDTYRPFAERALATANHAGRQALAAAGHGLARISEALEGDPEPDQPASPPRRVEVVEEDDASGDESESAAADFAGAIRDDLPLAISPAIELIDVGARNGNLELTMRLKRVVRERDRSLFVLTANERTRDIVCNDTETTAIRALSDANVGIGITYVDASDETIYEIDVLGGHCSEG